MTILRCNKCGHLEELPPEVAGTTVPCARCHAPGQVYDTVHFIGKVLEKLFALQVEAVRLRAAGAGGQLLARGAAAIPAADTFDPHNSDMLSTELQHGPIREWFQRRQIRVRTNPKAVDTTGFFDEVAVAIGKNYGALKEVVDRIRFAQLKGFGQATINLDRKTSEQAQLITSFCRQLYDYSFVAKCLHPRDDKPLRLVLQTAPAIREFFNGDWLEWLVLMTLLESARAHGRRYSCARNLQITLQNDETFELDVFFLVEGERPVCVECKSGEFRQDIDRCLTLRKRLGIDSDHFIVCAAGLGADQAGGLSSTYDLTFCSEQDLRERLDQMFAADSQRSARIA